MLWSLEIAPGEKKNQLVRIKGLVKKKKNDFTLFNQDDVISES